MVTRFNQDRIPDDVRYLVSKYRLVSVTFQPIVLFGRAVLSKAVTVPNLEKAAEGVNAAVRELRASGVKELKIAFFPHCFLEDVSLAEDHEIASDVERKRLLESVSKRAPRCSSCSRFGRCQ